LGRRLKNFCFCDNCIEPIYKIGLCKNHHKEYLSVAYRSKKRWAKFHNIYLGIHTKTFRNRGKLIELLCPKCGLRYVATEYGDLRRCPLCLKKRINKRVSYLNELGIKRKVSNKIMSNISKDQDERYKPFKHIGGPKKEIWKCEKSNCNNTYEVLLLNNKKWYFRFCEVCRVRKRIHN